LDELGECVLVVLRDVNEYFDMFEFWFGVSVGTVLYLVEVVLLEGLIVVVDCCLGVVKVGGCDCVVIV